MERHQVAVYVGAIAAGIGVGLLAPGAGHGLEPAINPALDVLLYATFLQVPATELARSLRTGRFLAAAYSIVWPRPAGSQGTRWERLALARRHRPAPPTGLSALCGKRASISKNFGTSAKPSRLAPVLLPTNSQSSSTNVHAATSSSGGHRGARPPTGMQRLELVQISLVINSRGRAFGPGPGVRRSVSRSRREVR